ncbi:hypothetical protein COJ96_05900 [Bacillus sp. AFS073361]|uniref:hypothetical protein n=1 Tax=Bacillus sp. AFS073361 TaxID=2033511 RepID=UPI000BF4F4C2|nr:hypothetical protein [Bacillus sp. AFS073361]PFP30244.1 hypothetical protein COJ96_05900 [Bacillus sp. AFS073361]
MENQKRFICGTCNELMELKYDDYYLEHRGEIELVTDVPQHICHTCEVIAVANEDIAKMHRIIDHNLFIERFGGYDDEQ